MTIENKLSKFEKIFIKMVKIYVRVNSEHSFKFIFGNLEYPQIGNSKNIVNVKFTDSHNVFRRIFAEGSLGLGEAYCEGKIDVKDSDYKHFIMILTKTISDKKLLLKLSPLDIYYILKARLSNSFFKRKNQNENINSHYSLDDWFEDENDSNQFYLYWLNSPYIQYSCAKWDSNVKTLKEAQINKFEFYAKRLGIDENSKNKTLLDLGCGWGGFMFYLSEKYGLKSTGLTLSSAQVEYIKKEIKKRGLEKNVNVKHQNIHHMKGEWDYIVSVGVLEHIDDYDNLYKKTAACLSKTGRALFHSMFHTGFIYKPDSFLTKYIFPGGGTPNLKKNLKVFKKYFSHVDRNDLPNLSYPKTLSCWFDNFCTNADKIKKLLKEKSKCEDVEYAIRIFKHYLTLAYCGLSNSSGTVSNVLVYN